jgi:hypothetical protein
MQDTDILVEKDSMSVTRGESSSETVKMRLVDQPTMAVEYRNDDAVDDEVYPEFVSALEDVTAKDGEAVDLRCVIKGAPPDDARVTWYKDDKEMEPSDEVRQSYDGAVALLRFVQVNPTSQAVYRCVVLTDNGMAETSAYLSVTGKSVSL